LAIELIDLNEIYSVLLKLFIKLIFTFIKFIFLNILLLAGLYSQAQLCTGTLGDPLVNINFGAGTNPGAQLSAATTSYQYVTNDCPNDGFYTVRNNTNSCFGNSWFSLANDHTGNTNGYFMLVNASIQPSAFYVDTVRGLCGNSTYEFAAWIINMSILQPNGCNGNPIQPNISFAIEKIDGTVLQSYNTNNIPPSTSAIWKQYGFFFNTPIGISDIVLRMTNNATGGCGNDIALDDITFRPCGPLLTPSIVGLPTTTTTLCEGSSKTFDFSCTVSSGFNLPTYQWQQSFNGAPFTDIIGQNSTSLQINFIPNAAVGVYEYRLSAAEAGNLNSLQCRISSTTIKITVNKKPITTCINDGPICEGNTITLTATGGGIYQWTGPNNYVGSGNTVTINTITLANAGIYNVLVKDVNGCEKTDFTSVIINQKPAVQTSFLDSTICAGKTVQLLAIGTGSFEWTPTATLVNSSTSAPIAKPTIDTKYTVFVTNTFGCKDSAYSNVTVVQKPVVNAGQDKIIVANRSVVLDGNVSGNIERFAWSPNEFISNINALQPIVNPPSNKQYTLTVTASKGCGEVSDSVFVKIYEGIFIPNSFTPNGDNKNDIWNIPALEAYPLHELTIYNRYGQVVFQRKKSFNGWDGKLKGDAAPAGAYTYVIDLKNGTNLIKGSLLIIR
jgi:gliding motility-associated-like protein